MEIRDAGLKFIGGLVPRRKTDAILLHHAAACSCTVQQVHGWHLAKGWSGVGYHYFVAKDGAVWRGRPEGTVGAHAGAESGYNSRSVGICFEGSYDAETSMPDAQYKAGVALVRDVLTRYPGCAILGHRDVTATACPGRHFPFERMKGDASMDVKDITYRVGQQVIPAKLIDGVTYVPVRAYNEAFEKALQIVWTPEAGGSTELK